MYLSIISRPRRIHLNVAVETKSLEDPKYLEADIGSYSYQYIQVTSPSRVPESHSKESSHLPVTPPHIKRMPFTLSTPVSLETPDLNTSSPPSPPRPKKRKFITVDQIQDRALQRFQCPLFKEFELENMGDCGGDKLRRKWRLSPRPHGSESLW
jgi:hypothetical protein|eukprot:scaffold11792_cov267-Chaetoceros_neogracile.AAC.1